MVKVPKIEGNIWFNSQPLKPKDLKNKVVLYDFWTYSCVNCIRTFPYLKKWRHKYKNLKFLIIGIHTPEFDFEKEPENVEKALKDFEIEWPVVLDNDYINWRNFANRFWPAKYLTDKEGNISYTHFGEDAYAETERQIQRNIRENLGDIPLPGIQEEVAARGGVCYPMTPELYLGYNRGLISNPEGYRIDEIFDYKRPEQMAEDSIALEGNFLARPTYLESGDENATIYLRFHGTEVNMVMRPVEGNEAKAEINLNGKSLEKNLRGRDIESDGKEVIIESPVMHNLIKSRKPLEGILSIKNKSGKFRAYAFTFSGCVE